jgi:hypothetical protein
MKRLLSTLFALGLMLGIFAGAAKADTTLGSISIPTGADHRPCDGDVIAETASDPSTPYAVPSAGTITSWRVRNFADPGDAITLVVLKNTGGISYSVVGADTHPAPDTVSDVLSFTVGSPIAVSGGEILALYEPTGTFDCYFQDGETPLTDELISLQTLSTPAAGQPLTQDESSGPGYRLNLEATLTPPAPMTPAPPVTVKKKKCKKKKKKKHKRSAASAKKKCKKKKKR